MKSKYIEHNENNAARGLFQVSRLAPIAKVYRTIRPSVRESGRSLTITLTGKAIESIRADGIKL